MQTKPTLVISRIMLAAVLVVIALMPFHAFLTVWLSQLVGHYTGLRLWKEVVSLGVLGFALVYVGFHREMFQRLRSSRLVWLIGIFLAGQVIGGWVALAHHQVTLEALGYGWIVDNRFVLFFLVTWVAGTGTTLRAVVWWRVALWPAAGVIVIGLLQYFVLPYDVLKHVGYSTATIFPYEDINHNVHYIRVMSSLRGANPLGAYLVVVTTLLLSSLRAAWQAQKRLLFAGLGAMTILSVIVLTLTFSRGAWLGMVVSVVALTLIWLPHRRLSPGVLGISGALVVVGVLAVTSLQHNATFQNVFWHTEIHSSSLTTSNAGHVSAFQQGLHEVLHEPLGRGPGTAGPASVYNTGHPVRIAENFFLQIGQEVGWLGLAVFLGINVLVGQMLWRCRSSPLALSLLASFVGLSVVNFFSHAWADDTLAYVWWGLAGVVYAITAYRPEEPTTAVETEAPRSAVQ